MDNRIVKKSNHTKTINKINKLMDSIQNIEETIQIVNDTLILCEGELIDKSTFSIMSLPSTKDILDDL